MRSPAQQLSMSFLFPTGTPAEIAARVEATVTGDDRQQWQQGTPEQWALKSLAIVRVQVYRLPASGRDHRNLHRTGTRYS